MDIEFHASVHAIKVDRLGEGKLTLTVPSSDLPRLIPAVTTLEKLLKVSIREAKPNVPVSTTPE